jgi:hypothetical protein
LVAAALVPAAAAAGAEDELALSTLPLALVSDLAAAIDMIEI